MLRFAVALLAVVVASGTAESADRAPASYRWQRAAGLPAGLPRPHYHFKTTITYAAPSTLRRPWRRTAIDEAPVPYAPVAYIDLPYAGPAAPVLDPDPYWRRLPYACGVYGYC